MRAATITSEEVERIHDALRDAWSECFEWIKVEDAHKEDGQEFPFYTAETRRRRERLKGVLEIMHVKRWCLDDMSRQQQLAHEVRRATAEPPF